PHFYAGDERSDELVSILIPARNEEYSLITILENLCTQTYVHIEVIVYDDCSTDGTSTVVHDYARRYSNVRLISGASLPDGWLGKNHACFSLAREAQGAYFLFLDADVQVSQDFVHKLMTYIQRKPADLLSIFPRQIMKTEGEKAVVPIMNYILLSLLPLFLVRWSQRFSSFSAANGQCMFFEAKEYVRIQPHEFFKMSRAEDIHIARYYKKNNRIVDCIASVTDIQCRMYDDYSSAIHGFSKNYMSFFGDNPLFGILFCIITGFGWAVVLFAMPIEFSALYFLAFGTTKMLVARVSNQSVFLHISYMAMHHISMVIVIALWIKNMCTKKIVWKGRNVY
ncbi:MAG: glycosyltransferase family 2 protein, partial [Bacteroidota bacterium]